MLRPLGPVLLASVLALSLLAACGKDKSPATSGSPAAGESTTTSASSSSAFTGTEINLIGREYAYDAGKMPASIPAGSVRVTLTNSGAEEHQATIVRLNDGVDLAALGAAAATDPTGLAPLKLVTAYGGPNAAGPGSTVTSTQVLDKPGSYLFLCFIPSPSDGKSHASKGMVLPFTVTGSASTSVSAPTTVSAVDFGYKIPDNLKSGTVALKNDGAQNHEMAIYKLASGKTLQDLLAFFAASESGTPPSGPPPFAAAGGLAALAPGATSTVDLGLSAGNYVLMCFLPDTAGSGAPHFTRGMAQAVTVT